MEIRTGSITFPRDKGNGPRSATDDVTFSGTVNGATVVMTGADYGFSKEDDDHHLGQVNLRLDSTILGADVRVTATFGVRDWSGNWDDDYEGTIYYAVLAEV